MKITNSRIRRWDVRTLDPNVLAEVCNIEPAMALSKMIAAGPQLLRLPLIAIPRQQFRRIDAIGGEACIGGH
jgi:hypothetical protein